MPIFEYECKGCGCQFECLVFGQEKPTCPDCKSTKVGKQMSACGFVSKGAGGQTVSSAGSSSCSGCKASSCSSCGH